MHFLAADPTVLARSHPDYRDLLNRGDLNIPDGLPVALAARLGGAGGARRQPGTDTLNLVADWGIPRGLRHYLFGGTQDVAGRMRTALEAGHPGIALAGVESPPFRELSPSELDASAERMRAAGAQIVWVGLGTPKQDFVAQELARRDAARVVCCVGAAFDFIAGTKTRAPRWMQHAGLEWAHRLMSEPRRLWRRYLVGNTRFVAGVATDLVRRRVRAG